MANNESAMKTLLGVYLSKQFGTYLEVDNVSARETELLKDGIRKMAEDIVESALLSGHRPVEGTGNVATDIAGMEMDNPLKNRSTVGAFCRSAFEATPAQFVAFCGFRLDEMRGKLEGEKQENKRQQKRYDKMVDILMRSWSIRKARKRWREEME